MSVTELSNEDHVSALGTTRPRFAYVLTTEGADVFADMNYVSAAFLREVHPEAEIVILCDSASYRALDRTRHPLKEVTDRLEAVATPDAPPGHRNRYVKTSMREVLDGTFVYLDADTLPARRLDGILKCPAPLAAIANHNGTGDVSEIPANERAIFETMGWELPSRPYVNGGVLFLRDQKCTREFGRLWHEKWLTWSRLGQHTDQPSLNSALADSRVEYAVLDGRYNAQIGPKPALAASDVALWHFYYSVAAKLADHNVPKTLLGAALARFRSEGRLSAATIRQLRGMPFPWVTRSALDRWFVRHKVLTRGAIPLDSPVRYWLAGYRTKAIVAYLASWWGRHCRATLAQLQSRHNAHSVH
jgi:hypothetical protein